MQIVKLKGLIKKKKQYVLAKQEKQSLNIPEGMYEQCPKCKAHYYAEDLKKYWGVCQTCHYHFPLSAPKRLQLILDEGSFHEMDEALASHDPLEFAGYLEKQEKLQEKTGLKEAVITGCGKIEGQEVVIAVMDARFMMGSMGSCAGEKITRAIEYATCSKLPLIIFTASGGARMQEGIFSLMQMAKTSAALAKQDEAGLLTICVLTDPTMGGVTASFATLGDIILAEPGALIGFAGPRVIAQTLHEDLPKDFQRAEFLLQHGQIDDIVSRDKLKHYLATLIDLHQKEAF